MAERYRYAAFVSYSSKDARFAQRLHRALERYRIPAQLGRFKLTGKAGKTNRVYPVFRDREELSAGDLGERIETGLREAAALIVVCSPNAAASPWVQKEIEFFIKLGRRDRIFAIIADDAPLKDKKRNDATPLCFPPAFRGDALQGGERAIEPLAADARPGKDGFRNAVLKVIAGLIGVTPGQIIDRDARERRAQLTRNFALAAIAIVSVGLAYSQRHILEPMAVGWWRYQRYAHSTAELMAASPGTAFQDCRIDTHDCPVMVVIPEGRFIMGSPEGPDVDYSEVPQREIAVARFAVSRTEITFDQWAVCVAAGRCTAYPFQDEGFGQGQIPAVNISWDDARGYAVWLSDMTGHEYRLLSEAEFEYATRAGSSTQFSWGDEEPVCDFDAPNGAAVAACEVHGPIAVGQFRPNAFGLYDMHGNVWEWVQDCYAFYIPGRSDPAPVEPDELVDAIGIDGQPPCTWRVMRSGPVVYDGWPSRSVARARAMVEERSALRGFRVARTL